MKRCWVAILAVVLLWTTGGVAKEIVFDPKNFSMNVQQAVRALQEIQNTQRIIEQHARHLRSLSGTNLTAIVGNIESLYQQLERIRGMAYDLSTIEDDFGDLYGKDGEYTHEEYEARSYEWSEQTRNAAYDAMQLQGQVKALIRKSEGDIAYAINASYSAEGSLQALQALAQEIGVLSNQLNEIVALQAANARVVQSEMMETNTDWELRKAEIQRNVDSLKEPLAPRDQITDIPRFQ